MKEIDFIPDWYKRKRDRQHSYLRQYAALGCLFAIMMTWNFITAASISRATAQVAQISQQCQEARNYTNQFAIIKNQIAKSKEMTAILDEIDSKIDVADILAELSYLIKENVIVNSFDLSAERLALEHTGISNKGLAIRAAKNQILNSSRPVTGDVRFKLVLKGLAVDASDVAELVCALEESPYFFQVILAYSRNKTVRAKGELRRWLLAVNNHITGTGKGYHVSEFELTCYIANYQQRNTFIK